VTDARGDDRAPPLKPLDRAAAADLFSRWASLLRSQAVEVPELGLVFHVREVPARYRLALEEAIGEHGEGRGAFEGATWVERVAGVLAVALFDPATSERILYAARVDAGEKPADMLDALEFVGSLPTVPVVNLYGVACALNRLGAPGVAAAAGESEGEPSGGSPSGSHAT
jgi:hypothetical protein